VARPLKEAEPPGMRERPVGKRTLELLEREAAVSKPMNRRPTACLTYEPIGPPRITSLMNRNTPVNRGGRRQRSA
jgi:hypothetical protein